jgi:hypothetical protein
MEPDHGREWPFSRRTPKVRDLLRVVTVHQARIGWRRDSVQDGLRHGDSSMGGVGE